MPAVWHEFAVLDHGAVRKRPDGRFRPGNVHAPLSAVVPDVLRQVELSVDRATREAIMAEANRKVRLGPLAALQVLSEYAATSAGRALVAAMGGGFIGDAALGLCLDSRVTPDQQSSRVAVLTEADPGPDFHNAGGAGGRVWWRSVCGMGAVSAMRVPLPEVTDDAECGPSGWSGSPGPCGIRSQNGACVQSWKR